MKHHALTPALAVSLALAMGAARADGAGDETAAIGVAGQADRVDRTIDVQMSDGMRFTPAQIAVTEGETIRLRIHNPGQLRHEFVLNTTRELQEHYALMKKFPEMEHADPNAVTVDPGKTGVVIWQFTRPGAIPFACLQPGHYDAGMKGVIEVTAAKAAAMESDGHVGHHEP